MPLRRRIPIFDGHNDVLLRLWRRGVPDAVKAFLEGETEGQLDDRFHESCHKRGIHSLSQTPICAVGALTRRIEKEWQRGGGRLKCRLEMRISRTCDR